MEFISLKALIYDLLNMIRGARPIDDEPITERQVEYWIHMYRAFYIKRDLDKGRKPNPDYIQNIDNISLEYYAPKKIYRTVTDVPNTLDLNEKAGISFVGDIYGEQIQLVPEKRVNWQKYTKWSQDETVAYLNSSKLYIYNSKGLRVIQIRGIFENPVEAAQANGLDYDYDSPYPIPISLIPVLKETILQKELMIEIQSPNDEVNDATHDIKQTQQA